MTKAKILAGDVGGTKTRLALYGEEKGGLVVPENMESYPSAQFGRLAEIVDDFLAKHQVSVERACFGVPGPVIDGRAKTTNLPWQLDETSLGRDLNIAQVKLVNDLAATTASLPYLDAEVFKTLHGKDLPDWHDCICAVLAPGTGLGQAYLWCEGDRRHAFATEGGHVDFAPNSDLEVELYQYLQKKFGHVSYERAVCGPGLVNIYEFLKYTGKAPEPPQLRERLENADDRAVVISDAGLAEEFEICVQTLDVFASVLGAQAGNMVLNLLATGGVFLGGGIPPKLIKKLSDGTTVKAYLAKGRLSRLVEATPLFVIEDDRAALHGAAHLAQEM